MNRKKHPNFDKNSEHYKKVQKAEAELNKRIRNTRKQTIKERMESHLSFLSEWLFAGLLLFSCFIIFVAIFVAFYLKTDSITYLGPFMNHVKEYSTISGLKNSVRTSPHRMQAYLKGKIITVNKENNRIDNIYFDLPEELRAAKPEDVGTIIWLKWGENKVGSYTDGEDAIVNNCHVTIIDKSISAIVDERNFRGSDPPKVKHGSGSDSGSMPTKEIVNYLQSLPKK